MRKFRDDHAVQHVMFVVADTRENRNVLSMAREALRGNFPLDTREALAGLRSGRCPGANALILL